MFRKLFIGLILALLVGGAYFLTEVPQARDKLENFLPKHELMTFEAKFTPDQLVQRYQRQVDDKGATYEDPSLEFYPFLLMEVKYVKGPHSIEGNLVWSLSTGEVVLNTHQWSSTHGYDDCLMARATHDEMRIIHALAEKGGQLDRPGLVDALKQDPRHIDEWLERCRKKQLITQTGNHWKLHMQHPLFCLEPTTIMKDTLVERSAADAKLMAPRYRSAQIIELAKAAFGQDFAIKRYYEVYLPIYSLVFKYADGSKRTLRFNAHSNTLYV